MTRFVVCEYGYDCNARDCSYTHPIPGDTIDKALCGHINKHVSIIEYQEVSTCNPNYLFKKRKRYGF